MNVHSKEFWEKVKTEYNPSYKYICGTSEQFYVAWESPNKYEIIKLAKKFLRYNFCRFRYWFTFTGGTVLFVLAPAKIRLDFIDWCIKKYSK
jgi:hypothetical protein